MCSAGTGHQEEILTDIENLQKKESDWEQAESQRELETVGQITELFMTLSPTAQAELLDVLSEDESDNEGPSEDDD